MSKCCGRCEPCPKERRSAASLLEIDHRLRAHADPGACPQTAKEDPKLCLGAARNPSKGQSDALTRVSRPSKPPETCGERSRWASTIRLTGPRTGWVDGTVFLTELLPEDSTLRRGLEEGADAALEARGKVHVSEEEEETPTPKRVAKAKSKRAA